MANLLELFALVEMSGPANPKPHPAMNALAPPLPAPTIKRIIRTYESNNRAQSDLELLNDAAPGYAYFIVTIQHIES